MLSLITWIVAFFIFTVPWENSVTLAGWGTISRILGLLVSYCGLIEIIRTRWIKPAPWLLAGFLLYSLYSVINAMGSPQMDIALVRVSSLIQSVIMIISLIQVTDSFEKYRLFLWAFVLGNIVQFAITITYANPLDPDFYRLRAENYNPNNIAFLLSMGVVTAWILLVDHSPRHRIFDAICVAAMISFTVGILLTGSRGGLIALAAGYLIILVSYLRSNIRKWYKPIGVVVVCLLLVQTLMPQSLWLRYSTLLNLETSTLEGRQGIWEAGLEAVQQSPIFGIGIGTYADVSLEALGREFTAHNTFVSIYVEQGIVGLALFVVPLALMLFQVWRFPHHQNYYGVAMIVVIIAMSLTATLHWNKVIWLVFGLLMSYRMFSLPNVQSTALRRVPGYPLAAGQANSPTYSRNPIRSPRKR